MPAGIKGFVKGMPHSEEHKARAVATRMQRGSYASAWNRGFVDRKASARLRHDE